MNMMTVYSALERVKWRQEDLRDDSDGGRYVDLVELSRLNRKAVKFETAIENALEKMTTFPTWENGPKQEFDEIGEWLN